MKKIIIGVWSVSLLLLTIFSYAFIDPNLVYLRQLFTGFVFRERGITTILYTVAVLALFFSYVMIVHLYKQKKFHEKDILRFVITTVFLLLFSYPAMLSYDIFNYIATAKVAFFYQENPYVIMPIEFVGDELLSFTHAANKVALYGPGWILLTVIPHTIGMHNFLLTLLSFKVLIVFFYFGTLFMLYKLSRSWYPILIFGLNPLVVIETLVSGHNDIVMIFFAVSTLYAMRQKKFVLAGILLLVSILIKYATVVFFPIALYVLIQHGKKREINWQKIYQYCAMAMGIIFMLSPFREEMYPWYASWFLVFLSLLINRKYVWWLASAFSCGLMLRYVPYMLLGSHFGSTPFLRIILMLFPLLSVVLYIIIKEKLWSKNISR